MFLEMLIEVGSKAPRLLHRRRARSDRGGVPAWKSAWKKLRNLFVPRKRDGLLINVKLQQIRQEREAFLKSQRESGIRGAEKRWRAYSEPMASPSKAHPDPNASPMAKHGHRSGSGSRSSGSDLKDQKEQWRGRATARADRKEEKNSDTQQRPIASWSHSPMTLSRPVRITNICRLVRRTLETQATQKQIPHDPNVIGSALASADFQRKHQRRKC